MTEVTHGLTRDELVKRVYEPISSDEPERSKFEAWLITCGYGHRFLSRYTPPGTYCFANIQEMWQAWPERSKQEG